MDLLEEEVGLGRHRFRIRLHPFASGVVVLLLVVAAVVGVVRGSSKPNVLPVAGTGPSGTSETAADDVDIPQSMNRAVDSRRRVDGIDTTADKAALENSGPIVLFVTGAVKNPGLVSVPVQSRVAAAVEQAGGLADDAELTSVNLARVAVDGEHLHVLRVGESAADIPSGASGPNSASSGSGDSSSGFTGGTGCVDLGSASVDQLQSLDGVGPKIAQRIVERRDSMGGFNSPEDLLSVSGIGMVLFERISAGLCK